MKPVGKIERVDLRDIWPHEAHDFTKWMANDGGLQLLSEKLGIEFEDPESESDVGSFNADIVARESGTGRRVVIENQLEDTNHDHLGKLVTYAAGTDAGYAVWVVKKAREEHQKAIEWLNSHTDEDLGFFLVEIDAVKIGDSLPAPMFSIVEKPNDWAKSTKAAGSMNETEKLRLAYWQRYREIADADTNFTKVFKPRKPSRDHWTNVSIGVSGSHISLLVLLQRRQIAIEFYVEDDKELAFKAINAIDMLSEAVGAPATSFEAKKAAGVRFCKEGCDVKKHPEKWDEYIKWQMDAALKLREALSEIGI